MSCCANGEKTWITVWSELHYRNYTLYDYSYYFLFCKSIHCQPMWILNTGNCSTSTLEVEGEGIFFLADSCSSFLYAFPFRWGFFWCFPVLLLCKLLSCLVVWSSNSASQCSVPGRWSLASGVEAWSSHRGCKGSKFIKIRARGGWCLPEIDSTPCTATLWYVALARAFCKLRTCKILNCPHLVVFLHLQYLRQSQNHNVLNIFSIICSAAFRAWNFNPQTVKP